MKKEFKNYSEEVEPNKLKHYNRDLVEMDISFLSNLVDESGVVPYHPDDNGQLLLWKKHIVKNEKRIWMHAKFIEINETTMCLQLNGIKEKVPMMSGNNIYEIEDLKLDLSIVNEKVSQVRVILRETRENYLLRKMHVENRCDRHIQIIISIMLVITTSVQVMHLFCK